MAKRKKTAAKRTPVLTEAQKQALVGHRVLVPETEWPHESGGPWFGTVLKPHKDTKYMWISLDGWKETFWFPASRLQEWVVKDEAGESNDSEENAEAMESVREAITGLQQLSAPPTPASSLKEAPAEDVNGPSPDQPAAKRHRTARGSGSKGKAKQNQSANAQSKEPEEAATGEDAAEPEAEAEKEPAPSMLARFTKTLGFGVTRSGSERSRPAKSAAMEQGTTEGGTVQLGQSSKENGGASQAEMDRMQKENASLKKKLAREVEEKEQLKKRLEDAERLLNSRANGAMPASSDLGGKSTGSTRRKQDAPHQSPMALELPDSARGSELNSKAPALSLSFSAPTIADLEEDGASQIQDLTYPEVQSPDDSLFAHTEEAAILPDAPAAHQALHFGTDLSDALASSNGDFDKLCSSPLTQSIQGGARSPGGSNGSSVS